MSIYRNNIRKRVVLRSTVLWTLDPATSTPFIQWLQTHTPGKGLLKALYKHKNKKRGKAKWLTSSQERGRYANPTIEF